MTTHRPGEAVISNGITIAPIAAHHKQAWEELYRGYADFYRRPMDEDKLATVWSWLFDPDHVLEGLIALDGERPVGLAHYRAMPSPLRGADIGFLDDLFVSPQARGRRVGEVMLDRLADIARDRGWAAVRWLTADDNYRARTLYDRRASKTTWNLYEMTA